MDKASTTITATTTTSVTNTKEKSRRISKKVNPIESNDKFNHTDYTRSIHPTTTTTTTGPIANGSIQQNHQQHNHCHHPFSQFYSTSHLNNNKDKNNDSYDDDDNDNDDNNDDNIIDNHNNNIDIIHHHYNMDDNDGDYDDDCDDDYNDIDNDIDRNSTDSIETCSDELPVWAFGEQRWISGVNEDTTCSDLINVLLTDEGLIGPTLTQHNHHHYNQHNNYNQYNSSNHHSNQLQQQQQTKSNHQHQQQKQFSGLPGIFLTSKLHDPNLTGITNPNTTTTTQSSSTTIDNNKIFVITERWRRVEQILSNDTKVLQIWSAWGQAKSEVKLTLRQIDSSLSLDTSGYSNNDKDSGMGSPIGSTNSAIMRRRKHRASKSTAAWVTQAQTMHPKSQKTQIEKLMKLILEQGETIQQQLAKLRDRELQIAKIEEERHKNREKEHGKNYLLETYLNGLHEIEEKEVVTGNSDSGIQTEGALSSPEICSSSNQNEDEDYLATATTIQQSTSILASLPTPKIQKHNPKYYDTNNSNNTTYLATLSTPQIGTKISAQLPINGIRSLATATTTTITSSSRTDAFNSFPFKEKPSHREKKLLKEHKQTKEFSSYLKQQHNEVNSKGLSGNAAAVMASKITTITKLKSLGARVVASSSSLLSNALDTHNSIKAQQHQNQNESTKNLSNPMTTSNNVTIDDNITSSGYRVYSCTDVATNVNHPNKDIKNLYTGNSNSNSNSNSECIGQDYCTTNVTIDYNNGKINDMIKSNGVVEEEEENLSEKIQWMEKLVMINKHLQREEELLVRLGAKIRKYESENPLLDENQIRDALGKVNNHLETGNMEIEKLELDLLATKEQLEKKSNLLQSLNKELLVKENEESEKLLKLKQTENDRVTPNENIQSRLISDDTNDETKLKSKKKSETRKVGFSNSIKVVDIPLDDDYSDSEFNKNLDSQTNNEDRVETKNEINNNNKDEQDHNEIARSESEAPAATTSGETNQIPIETLNQKDLVENLYNYSQYISKPNYDFNEKNETKNNKLNDEKLLSSVCGDGSNTLPLRSKKTHGILKNKYVPQSTIIHNNNELVDNPNSNTVNSSLGPNLLGAAPQPISEIFLTPPLPPSDFIDSSNQFNSNDLLTTVPAIMQTNQQLHQQQQQQQQQQLQQQQQQQQYNQYQPTGLNKFVTLDKSFHLNHAKNLNFSKQTTTEINFKNLNPSNPSLTKIDFSKKSSLYQMYGTENSLPLQLQSKATPLQPINSSLNSNMNLTTTNQTTPIERSLLSSVPIEYKSSGSSSTASRMNLGVSEKFLISNQNSTNHRLLHNTAASSPGNSSDLSSGNIYATDFSGTNPMITTATNTSNHNNTILPRLDFNDNTTAGTAAMKPRNPMTTTINGIGNGSVSYDTNVVINYNNNNMYNGNIGIHEIGIGNRTNLMNTNTNNKFGPKRFINTNTVTSSQGGIIGNEFESNSDAGVGSLSDDVLHLGTLV